jgi:hypothetical protein
MIIAAADIAQFKKNFDDGVRQDIPIAAGHDKGMSGGELPAVGWFKEAIDRGVNGLYCTVEWTAETFVRVLAIFLRCCHDTLPQHGVSLSSLPDDHGAMRPPTQADFPIAARVVAQG